MTCELNSTAWRLYAATTVQIWKPLFAFAATGFIFMGCSSTTPADTMPALAPPLRSTIEFPLFVGNNNVLPANVKRGCADSSNGVFHCALLERTDIGPLNQPDSRGYAPSDLQSAYRLPSKTRGKGQTIAIIMYDDDPKAESDLKVYRSTFGLPPCTTANGCFTKLNQHGEAGHYPKETEAAGETALDIEMVSATCPNCHILLVEFTATIADAAEAVDTAIAKGANIVSNSWDNSVASSIKYASHFDRPGHIIVTISGDEGYLGGILFPAALGTVVSVGGTSLIRDGSRRGWYETVWNSNGQGTGSGCTAITKPRWQRDSFCRGRMDNDVAAVADPETGVWVYLSYRSKPGWTVEGGTSDSAPIIAGIYGLAENASRLDGAESLYEHKDSLFDIQTGFNGYCRVAPWCTAERGYDGPTGNGTPNGVAAF